jgi:parvulin-like peptidyl-prolyl isomerase
MKARFSHILVNQKFEAEDILKHLKNGKIFSELASKYSTCSSAAAGGDLGFVAESRLDPNFAEEAYALKVGSYTSYPVKTRFGYHIILRTA